MGDPMDDRKSFTVSTYLADKEHDIRLIRWLLKSICLWPHSGKISIVDQVFSKFLILTYFFVLFMTMVNIGLVIFIEEPENMDVMMINIGPFIYILMTIMKYISLLLHVDDIRSCVDYIEFNWNIVKSDIDHVIMLKDAKIGRLIATCIAVSIHSATQSYNITKFFITNIVDVDNVSVSIRELPFPFYNEIVDTRFSPAYEVVLVMHCISSFLLSSVTSVNCGLMAILVMHACGQLKILIQRLGDIVREDDVIDVNTVKQKLDFIVEHHLQVIKYVSHIEAAIHLTCFVEVIGGSVLLCFVGYCCITTWSKDQNESIPTYSILATSLTLNIFIICYIADVLSEQYRRVGTATYMMKWYRLPPKTALGLLMINLRCNFNVSLTAGKMIELSLYTFGNVLKASITYLNMLRQMTV